jgi:hypothetical protein
VRLGAKPGLPVNLVIVALFVLAQSQVWLR